MKKKLEITGNVAGKIIEGERAFILGRNSRMTSVVEKILSETDEKIVFETKNTLYTLNKAA